MPYIYFYICKYIYIVSRLHCYIMRLDFLHVKLDGYRSKFVRQSADVRVAVLGGSSMVSKCDAGGHGQSCGAAHGQICGGSRPDPSSNGTV